MVTKYLWFAVLIGVILTLVGDATPPEKLLLAIGCIVGGIAINIYLNHYTGNLPGVVFFKTTISPNMTIADFSTSLDVMFDALWRGLEVEKTPVDVWEAMRNRLIDLMSNPDYTDDYQTVLIHKAFDFTTKAIKSNNAEVATDMLLRVRSVVSQIWLPKQINPIAVSTYSARLDELGQLGLISSSLKQLAEKPLLTSPQVAEEELLKLLLR